MAEALAVWLYGDHVATVERDHRGPRLTYTGTALARYELGTPLLTLSLPVDRRTYPQGVVRSFLDGLLPEGEARRAIARDTNAEVARMLGVALRTVEAHRGHAARKLGLRSRADLVHFVAEHQRVTVDP